MSDVKIVIALLCKHLRQVVDSTLKPEHFRLAKFNKDTEDTVIELWKVLLRLSYCALKDIHGKILLNDYDDVTFVKLSFAFLQYPVTQFYALSSNGQGGKGQGASRELLLALAWLLATQDVLATSVNEKISNSILSQEFSTHKLPKDRSKIDPDHLSLKAGLNKITHISGQINYNLKSIFELVSEEVKLVTKIHAASINVCGLPHLSVSEMAMVKRFALKKSDGDQCRMSELQELTALLDTHTKWETKQNIFFDWMVTVIEEHKKSEDESAANRASDCELIKFICLLRHIVKKNLHNLKHLNEISSDSFPRSSCVSRLCRTQSDNIEAETWLSEAKILLENEEDATEKKNDLLAIKLKKILNLIPHCVQI